MRERKNPDWPNPSDNFLGFIPIFRLCFLSSIFHTVNFEKPFSDLLSDSYFSSVESMYLTVFQFIQVCYKILTAVIRRFAESSNQTTRKQTRSPTIHDD